jgi:hypothetical protein
MVTQQELYSTLCGVGASVDREVPVAYRAFTAAKEPPFICYLVTNDDDVIADDENYAGIDAFAVELYTNEKDLALEAALEGALRGLGIVWAKTEAYIESERMLQVTYSFDLV